MHFGYVLHVGDALPASRVGLDSHLVLEDAGTDHAERFLDRAQVPRLANAFLALLAVESDFTGLELQLTLFARYFLGKAVVQGFLLEEFNL